jgi:hypothetical protein
MAHLKQAMDSPADPPTASMWLGSLMHAGVLEPLELIRRYAVMPDFAAEIRKPDGSQYSNVRASKAYKDAVAEFEAQNAGKEIVSQEQYEQLLGVAKALQANERARQWLTAPGPVEVSIAWNDPVTGILCKARLDKFGPDCGIVDLKTTRDGSTFEKAIANFGYHRQLAMYAAGVKALTGQDCPCRLIAVEPTAPYGVRAAQMDRSALQLGYDEFRQLIDLYAAAAERNQWPSYEDPDCWQLPAWALPKSEPLALNVAGETIAI